MSLFFLLIRAPTASSYLSVWVRWRFPRPRVGGAVDAGGREGKGEREVGGGVASIRVGEYATGDAVAGGGGGGGAINASAAALAVDR